MYDWRLKEERLTYAWHCPDCGNPILVPTDHNRDVFEPAEWNDFAEGSPPCEDEIMEARQDKLLNANGLPKNLRSSGYIRLQRLKSVQIGSTCYLSKRVMKVVRSIEQNEKT